MRVVLQESEARRSGPHANRQGRRRDREHLLMRIDRTGQIVGHYEAPEEPSVPALVRITFTSTRPTTRMMSSGMSGDNVADTPSPTAFPALPSTPPTVMPPGGRGAGHSVKMGQNTNLAPALMPWNMDEYHVWLSAC